MAEREPTERELAELEHCIALRLAREGVSNPKWARSIAHERVMAASIRVLEEEGEEKEMVVGEEHGPWSGELYVWGEDGLEWCI